MLLRPWRCRSQTTQWSKAYTDARKHADAEEWDEPNGWYGKHAGYPKFASIIHAQSICNGHELNWKYDDAKSICVDGLTS